MSNIFDNNRTVQQVVVAGAAVSAILTLLAAKYNDRPIGYEHPKGIPYKSGLPLLGNLPLLLNNKERIYDFQLDLLEELDTLTMTLPVAGNPTAVLTIDPQNVNYFLKENFKNYLKGPKFKQSLGELLGNGIFNANGEQWRYQRKTASHIFNVKNFRDDFTDVFVKEMLVMCSQIMDKAAKQRTVIDFHDLMFKFTLDSFVYLGFGVQLNSLLQENKVPFAVSFDHLQRLGALRFIDPFRPLIETATRFIPWKMSTQDHIRVIDKFAADVIAQRRKEIAEGKTDHKDLLSRFMNTDNENGEKLNDVELRDTVLNFIIAGRDTTAQALSWLFYNISLQPRIEQKMLEEIEKNNITDELEKDSPALYEVISNMHYLHAVFYETLRLHPSVPSNQKYALEDDVWPDGTVIKAGYYINWTPYAQGRSTKIWGPNAKEFYPERWIDEEGHLRRENAGKWPVFHAGPRVCLGQNLATLEALVCVAMLLKRYSFDIVADQTVTYDLSLTLPMKYGLKLYVRERSTSSTTV
ncbi:cytochrome P450 [Mycotypha africana]|uniref:cytochrome P450 n=1 Tax=Mycotypha africana TaxID=64632 RepID=UPI002301B291|nr:cytochrome P450 [Mycotypha africana]KAI8987644.1 cytochrome P450 [Mycotypha africana]